MFQSYGRHTPNTQDKEDFYLYNVCQLMSFIKIWIIFNGTSQIILKLKCHV